MLSEDWPCIAPWLPEKPRANPEDWPEFPPGVFCANWLLAPPALLNGFEFMPPPPPPPAPAERNGLAGADYAWFAKGDCIGWCYCC